MISRGGGALAHVRIKRGLSGSCQGDVLIRNKRARSKSRLMNRVVASAEPGDARLICVDREFPAQKKPKFSGLYRRYDSLRATRSRPSQRRVPW
jgi:hypothetical protein